MNEPRFTKQFSPCIYFYQSRAVRSDKDLSIVKEDPVLLAKYYVQYPINSLVVVEIPSETNHEGYHDEYIEFLKFVNEELRIQLWAYTTIERMEDAKKLIYTGANIILPEEVLYKGELLEDIASKFGKEKFRVAYDHQLTLETHFDRISQNSVGICLMDIHKLKDALSLMDPERYLPINLYIEQRSLGQWMDILSTPYVQGTFGNLVCDTVKELLSFKRICQENHLPIEALTSTRQFDEFKTDAQGLVTVIVQEDLTNELLMVAYMNQEAYELTLLTGRMTYFSRERQKLWVKGETSGHFQYVKELRVDCDQDAILAKVTQVGVACHTGSKSCFFETMVERNEPIPKTMATVLLDVYGVIYDRKEHPKEGSYTNYLFEKGLDKILKKVGEEATEIVIAAKNPNINEVKYEISDFLYHIMVLMAHKGITWEEILSELAHR
ncbi:MAG: bifunctional phosphoribosyl-AMP cyclohydrolase/phosphoribosyl-ATP diphosphatase HisIE [Lachnospiraceae bacterium]|jgi:phosphoribosyl-ATP pyrophosphohydrolase/phosphoribosyl-AMP cyclohydrolase|nr:bifunctional phosphoribosyl-AMP cyclohydrolase/phosphoribosyl-ATP diphosphatase HisIE [Lachnospiraceae bacterium]